MRALYWSVLSAGALALAPRVSHAQAGPSPDAASPPPADIPVVRMDNTSGGQPSSGRSAAAPAPAPAIASTPTSAPAPGSIGTPGGSVSPGGPTSLPAGADGPGEWRWDFHGYFRAPLLIGIGKRDEPLRDQSSTTFHRPIVPDDQYLSWQYTGHQARDWAELFLSYGNNWVKGTVGILGFSFTDAAFQSKAAQFGIAQGFITVNHDLGYENVRFQAKVGSFWARYGTAGKYDAGKYDTFVFGRTHVLGGTARIELDVGKLTLWGEEGFGAKQPDPSIYNNARFTLLQHIHGGLSYNKWVDLSVHHLYSWTQEEDRDGSILKDVPNGSLSVVGADIRLRGGMYGELYAGYSHIGADHAITVAPAIEVLHSNGGGEFGLGVTSNYLDGPTKQSKGNGSVDSLSLQYDFSVTNLLENLKKPGSQFWGEGRDLTLSLFTMMNFVSSEDKDADGVMKLKYGADVVFSALPWLAFAARYDRVQPNSKVPEQSFAILSPRLIFRSQWITHEEIFIQYSRYFYNQRTCDDVTAPTLCVQPPNAPVLPDGFGATTGNQDPNTRGAPTTRPDLNVIKLQASIWW